MIARIFRYFREKRQRLEKLRHKFDNHQIMIKWLWATGPTKAIDMLKFFNLFPEFRPKTEYEYRLYIRNYHRFSELYFKL